MPLDSQTTRLETAVAAVNATQSRLDKIEHALDETKTKSYDARRRREQCKREVEEAQQREARRAVDSLLGEATDAVPLADYEAALADADREYESLKKLIVNLQVEQQAAERQLRDAVENRTNAVRAVMNSHPAVVGLYKKYAALSDELVATNAALQEVFRAGGNPHNWRFFAPMERVERRDFDPRLRDAWQRAIKQLETTGEAVFPKVD